MINGIERRRVNLLIENRVAGRGVAERPAHPVCCRRAVNPTTRRAVVGDERTLAELNGFVHDLHLMSNPAYFRPAEAEEVAAWFRGLLENPTVKIWIAEAGALAVGYVSAFRHERAQNPFCRSRRWLEIDQVGVHPDWRRKGIGQALVDVVLQAARDEGIGDVELSSWVFNGDAHAAFRRLGFTPKMVRFGRP
jgi:GNAT superfamily N-acetyltransferase